jgi:hypothetical protein
MSCRATHYRLFADLVVMLLYRFPRVNIIAEEGSKQRLRIQNTDCDCCSTYRLEFAFTSLYSPSFSQCVNIGCG